MSDVVGSAVGGVQIDMVGLSEEGDRVPEQPRVTVGLPVFNDPTGLLRTVPSVFGQTWQGPLRLLVIDDGSTDETPEVLASLAEFYGRIDVVRNETNRGRPFARNRVLDLAEGYVAWIDAGDLWHPRKLELQLETLLKAENREPDVPFLCIGPHRWVFADRGQNRVRVPETGGDQLYNALTGSLFPYLQAIVGRVEHFRNLGGFDDKLLRRQDYDFLVRFTGSGGRVVSSPPETPVFTYLKSDVGGAAPVVARSNKVIRRKHRQFYRRYDLRLFRRVRGNQSRLVARFYRHNGRTVQSLAYRAQARLWSPDLLGTLRRTANRVVKLPGRIGAAAGEGFRRLLLPVVWLGRRTGAIALVRRIRPIRRLAGGQFTRVLGHRVVSVPSDDVEALEATVRESEAPVDLDIWLWLERAYRSRGEYYSAEGTLRRALDAYPGEPKLQLRLVELLPLRRKWKECTGLWEGLEPSARASGESSLPFARAAWAQRELGNPTRALAVAEEGLRYWARDPALEEERLVNRAALVDWRRAIVGTGATLSGEAAGVVTTLGFLAGGNGPIEGLLKESTDHEPRASLVVNGMAVATTGGVPTTGGAAFSLSCQGLLPYLGDGDTVSVESGSRPLEIKGYGTRCEVTTGYESRFSELERQLLAGFVFTKFGALRRGNTRRRKEQVLALYEKVSTILSESHGYVTYPFYGNLLGAVREHDFIGHDVGGFDMGYISRYSEPEKVRADFVEVCLTLLDHGMFLRLEPWSAYVRTRHNSRVYVDVNYAWFSVAGQLQFSFGWRYAPVTQPERVLFPRESSISGHLVRVPGNAEEVLEQLYGSSWAVPDQGFALDAHLKRDLDFLLTEDELVKIWSHSPDHVLIRTVLNDTGQAVPYNEPDPARR